MNVSISGENTDLLRGIVPPCQPNPPLCSLTSPPWEPLDFLNILPNLLPWVYLHELAHVQYRRWSWVFCSLVVVQRISPLHCRFPSHVCHAAMQVHTPHLCLCTAFRPVHPPTPFTHPLLLSTWPTPNSLLQGPCLLGHSGSAIAELYEICTLSFTKHGRLASPRGCVYIWQTGHSPPARQWASFPLPHSFRTLFICTNIYSFINLTEFCLR